jgi:hypothetical protein
MGFRNKRRHRGGGGGGQHHHHHQGFGTGEPNGLQPGDDIGNRKSFKVVPVPPDDIGNRKDPEEAEWIPEDSIGNRIDAAPTHELSGILLELDGKRRRRRPKGVAAPERVGRYFVGGVNPLIATNIPRPFPGKSLDESLPGGAPAPFSDDAEQRAEHGQNGQPRDWAEGSGEGAPIDGEAGFEGGEGEGGGRRRRRRGRGRDQVDGVAAQEVSERRAQRFFDFEEDDRFDYTLKTSAEQKRKDAEDAVRSIVVESGRDATVLARLIEDGSRPKVLVTIDERGPASSLPPERRAPNANEPLFVMGNAALMSLNYLVNKIVNRYPDDRIRLAILPAADERLYVDALAEHQKLRRGQPAPQPAQPMRPPALSPVPTRANGDVPLAVVEAPAVSVEPTVVVTPAPVGVAAPKESFEEPVEKPEHLVAPPKVVPAAVLAETAPEVITTVDDAADEEAAAPKKKAAARRTTRAKDEDADDDKKPAKKASSRASRDDDKKPASRPRARTKAAPVVEKVVVKAPKK